MDEVHDGVEDEVEDEVDGMAVSSYAGDIDPSENRSSEQAKR